MPQQDFLFLPFENHRKSEENIFDFIKISEGKATKTAIIFSAFV
jgi:hypothetical protein